MDMTIRNAKYLESKSQTMAEPGLHLEKIFLFVWQDCKGILSYCILSYWQRVKWLLLTSTISNLTICACNNSRKMVKFDQ